MANQDHSPSFPNIGYYFKFTCSLLALLQLLALLFIYLLPLLEMSFFCLLLKLVLSYPVQILQISSGFYELGKQSQMIKMYFKYIFNKDPACCYSKKKREKAEYKRKKRSLKIQFRTKYVTTINEHYC